MPHDRNGQALIEIVGFSFVLAVTILVAFLPVPFRSTFILLLGAIIFVVSFIRTDFALLLLIFSMLLSPEMEAGRVTGRSVVIRADDIYIGIIFIGWLAKMAVNKELGLLRATPLNRPILAYIGISVIATLVAALWNRVRITDAWFYLLKYFEYFLLFFLVSNNLKSRREAKQYVYALLLVAGFVSIYAWQQHFSGIERATAPFEGTGGEANTLGGYLIIMIMIALSFLINASTMKTRAAMAVLLLVAVPAFFFTLSRSSWFSFLPALLVFFFLTPRGKALMLVIVLVGVLLSPVILPRFVQERVKQTFTGTQQYEFMGRKVVLDDSSTARLQTWQYGLRDWTKSPLLGFGVSSVGPSLDNQYVRVLMETGAVGFLAFIFLMVSIFSAAVRSFNAVSDDEFSRCLILAFLSAFVGLLVHALGAATFILVRIMEPFWFLVAIIILLPELTDEGEEIKEA